MDFTFAARIRRDEADFTQCFDIVFDGGAATEACWIGRSRMIYREVEGLPKGWSGCD